MATAAHILQKWGRWPFTLGCSPTESAASNRITVFTNTMALFACFMGLSLYGQMGSLGVPQKYIFVYNILTVVAFMVLVWNYFNFQMAARWNVLLVILMGGAFGSIFFGKSFNGHYVFFVAITYSAIAFSLYSTWVRAVSIVLAYIGLPLSDYFYYHNIFPITDLFSRNFPFGVLVSDTILMPGLIIIALWIEKSLANKHEKNLEVALDTIQNEKNKMKTIFDNIELGILMTDQTLKVDSEYSNHLKSIFKTENIENSDLIPFLFSKSRLSHENQDIMGQSLKMIIGEDEMNWELNRTHFINELQVEIENVPKHLKLSWAPVIHDEQVQKMIVTVQDVTEEKKAREAARFGQILEERGRLVLAALLKVGMEQATTFIDDLDQYTPELVASLSPETLKFHQRKLHTLKGESRFLGFEELSSLIHQLEAELGFANKDELRSCPSLESLLNYSKELKIVSGKMFKSMTSEKKNWSLCSFLGQLKMSLNEQLSERGSSLIIGRLDIQDAVSLWPEVYSQPVRNIIFHAFQNSIDHGYIHPELKEDVELTFLTYQKEGQFVIEVKDRGAGLNVDKINMKYNELPEKIKSGLSDPNEVLFLDQVSTAEKVSSTSGRGVGLSSIQAEVKAFGGSVSIKNREDGRGGHLTIYLPNPN